MSATAFQRMRREKAKAVLEIGTIEVEPGAVDNIIDRIKADIETAHELALEEEKIRELEKLTVKDLKHLLDEKEIKYDSKARKDDLVKLLEGKA